MMAYTDQGYWASVGRSEFGTNFYNFDQPVFPWNSSDDVLLLQYLAYMATNWYLDHDVRPSGLGLGSDGAYLLTASDFDGIYGPRTRRAVLFLETALKHPHGGSHAYPVVADGIVRPVPRGEKVSSQTGTQYKLGLFNNIARMWADDCDPDQYHDMPNHWATPARLQVALQQNVRE